MRDLYGYGDAVVMRETSNMKSKIPFKEYEVDADGIVDFLDRYYKPERFRGRGKEYATCLIESHQGDLDKHGYDIISHHDSITGKVVCYRPQ